MREEYMGKARKKIMSTTKKEQELSSPSLSICHETKKIIIPRNAQTAKGNFSTDPATTPE
jgi:glutaredoxin 2